MASNRTFPIHTDAYTYIYTYIHTHIDYNAYYKITVHFPAGLRYTMSIVLRNAIFHTRNVRYTSN